MPAQKRKFLCQGCRGNMTGEIPSCGLVSCSFAENQEVQAQVYEDGVFFESCPFRQATNKEGFLSDQDLRILAKNARVLREKLGVVCLTPGQISELEKAFTNK